MDGIRFRPNRNLENQSKPCSRHPSASLHQKQESEFSFWVIGWAHAMRPSGLGGWRQIVGRNASNRVMWQAVKSGMHLSSYKRLQYHR
jgi:hypothetical protein